MEIWSTFTGAISQSITFLSSQFDVSQAIAIILVTIIARLILMPINTRALINSYRNKQKLAKIKPQLERIKKLYQDNPAEMMKRSMALHKKHNIKMFDKNAVANMTSQGVLGVGMFQTLQQMVLNSKFAWIASIAKPDVGLALLVGFLTYLSMVAMPGSAEQAQTLLFIIPAVISFVV
jgi:YidC/Oxa1 family membrane protein insertase